MGIFKTNWETIRQHNQEYEEGKQTYSMGLNSMSDWTTHEFRSRNTYRRSQRHGNGPTMLTYDATSSDSVPSSVNWTAEVRKYILGQ